MSRKALEQAWKAKVASPDAKFIYIHLAWGATDDGEVAVDPDTGEMLARGIPQDWPLMSWAWEQSSIPPRAKFLLVALAQLADASDAAPLVMADLKAMTSMPALEINAALRRLEKRGLITVDGGTAHLRMSSLN